MFTETTDVSTETVDVSTETVDVVRSTATRHTFTVLAMGAPPALFGSVGVGPIQVLPTYIKVLDSYDVINWTKIPLCLK